MDSATVTLMHGDGKLPSKWSLTYVDIAISNILYLNKLFFSSFLFILTTDQLILQNRKKLRSVHEEQ